MATDSRAVLEELSRAAATQTTLSFDLYNMRRSIMPQSAERPEELARLAAAERILMQAHQDLAELIAQQRQAQQ